MKDYIVRATAANAQIRAFAAQQQSLWKRQEQGIIQVRLRQQHLDDFLQQVR